MTCYAAGTDCSANSANFRARLPAPHAGDICKQPLRVEGVAERPTLAKPGWGTRRFVLTILTPAEAGWAQKCKLNPSLATGATLCRPRCGLKAERRISLPSLLEQAKYDSPTARALGRSCQPYFEKQPARRSRAQISLQDHQPHTRHSRPRLLPKSRLERSRCGGGRIRVRLSRPLRLPG